MPLFNENHTVSIREIINHVNNASLDDDIVVFETSLENMRLPYPIRNNALSFVLVSQGSGRIRIDLNDYPIASDSLIVLQPKNYYQLLQASPDLKAKFVLCSLHVVEDVLPRLTDILPLLIHHRTEPVSELTREQAQGIIAFHSFLESKIRGPKTPFLKNKLLCMLQGALYEMMDINIARNNVNPHQKTRKEELMAKFILAVSEDFRISRQVSYYATKLCISAKHLSTIVKQTSGRTAGEWIENYIVMEAKVLLKTTDLSIQEIAMQLNFKNQSFFGKYFKHVTGLSPSDFRRQHS
jgi:hypothetical protein